MTSRILPFLHASILACLYSWLLTFLHSDILAYFNTDSWTSHPTSSPSPSHISREEGLALLLHHLHSFSIGIIFFQFSFTLLFALLQTQHLVLFPSLARRSDSVSKFHMNFFSKFHINFLNTFAIYMCSRCRSCHQSSVPPPRGSLA